MRRIIVIVISFLFLSNLIYADDSKHNVILDANQVKIQVRGVVCSFCAFGVYKNLSKLKSLDSTQFKKGVHIDINNQMITLAMDDSHSLSLNDVYKSIKKGGYEPVDFYVPFNGKTVKIASEKILDMGDLSFQEMLKELKLDEGVSGG